MRPEASNQAGFTPFFVVDRQASLRIISGLHVPLGKRIGLMTHVNAHAHFKAAFRRFANPAPDLINPENAAPNEVIGNCGTSEGLPQGRIVTICDSGVFTKDGCTQPEYGNLFAEYRDLSVNYGVAIDFLKDKQRTLDSAEQGMDSYKDNDWGFRLVGVAQGESVDEYVDCYRELKRMGYQHVAVGGMLQKKEKSARYVYVRDEKLLRDTLSAIREIDPAGWLFALGCYSPQRHPIFVEHSVFGSDYKGWIFQYTCRSPRKGNMRYQNMRFRQVRRFIEGNVLAQSQRWGVSRRLLIVSCSKAKRQTRGRVQAINLYNGPVFTLLRKHLKRFGIHDGLNLLIFSGKYGLITPDRKIAMYDEKMNIGRANDLREQVRGTLMSVLSQQVFSEIALNLGADYTQPIVAALDVLITKERVVTFEGRIGERLSQTKSWILSQEQ